MFIIVVAVAVGVVAAVGVVIVAAATTRRFSERQWWRAGALALSVLCPSRWRLVLRLTLRTRPSAAVCPQTPSGADLAKSTVFVECPALGFENTTSQT